MAAADKPQRLFFRRRCVGRIPRCVSRWHASLPRPWAGMQAPAVVFLRPCCADASPRRTGMPLRQYARRLPGYDPYRPERTGDTSHIVQIYYIVRRSVCYLLMKRQKTENFFGFMGFLSIFATGSEIFECYDPSSERTHYRPSHADVRFAGYQVGTNGRHRAAARGVEADALRDVRRQGRPALPGLERYSERNRPAVERTHGRRRTTFSKPCSWCWAK